MTTVTIGADFHIRQGGHQVLPNGWLIGYLRFRQRDGCPDQGHEYFNVYYWIVPTGPSEKIQEFVVKLHQPINTQKDVYLVSKEENPHLVQCDTTVYSIAFLSFTKDVLVVRISESESRREG